MKKKQRILIIEDMTLELQEYCRFASELDYDVSSAKSFKIATMKLEQKAYDIVLTDIYLRSANDNEDGFQIISIVKENFPNTLIIAMSARVESCIYNRSLDLGAHFFIKKPLASIDEFAVALKMAKTTMQQNRAYQRLSVAKLIPNSNVSKYEDGIVLGDGIRHLVKKIADSGSISTIISGETGTGKEEVAKLIHKKRMENENYIPFVHVNCANLTKSLAESIIFGHKKGAFTGAISTTTGLIGDANGGILFLDEVHCLSRDLQSKMLRVLNDGSYQRLGETFERNSIFQVIAATNVDLDAEIDKGNFNLDFYSRLAAIEIQLKPLRELYDQLPLLINLFFAKNNTTINPQILECLIEKCRGFYWQGNIRQLFQVLSTTLLLSGDCEEGFDPEKLVILKRMLPPATIHENCGSQNHAIVDLQEESAISLLRRALKEDLPFGETVERIEKEILTQALKRHRKMSNLAHHLDIPRTTLLNKRKKFNLG